MKYISSNTSLGQLFPLFWPDTKEQKSTPHELTRQDTGTHEEMLGAAGIEGFIHITYGFFT